MYIDPLTIVRTLVGVGVLGLITVAVLVAMRAPHPAAPLLAVLRGLVQLAILSVILSGVITDGRWVAVALVVMLAVAIGVAARRIGWSWRAAGIMAVSITAGAGVALTIAFGTGAIDLTPRYALALGGIVLGNAMTIATLAGRGFVNRVDDRWEEVEGWLALGARPRQATRDAVRYAIYSALIPTTDQTNTTGLVTLPGAFVGAIFGGVSPLEAGRFQIVVLAAIMAAGAITASGVATFLASVTRRPRPLV